MSAYHLSVIAILITTFVTLIAAMIFYARHWAAREERRTGDMSVEGTYFRRWVPTARYASYVASQQAHLQARRQRLRNLQHMFGLGLGGMVTAMLVVIMVNNFDRWSPPIDLSHEERAAIAAIDHDWVRQVDQNLPHFASYVSALNTRGVALVSAVADDRWTVDGERVTAKARERWRKYLSERGVRVRDCRWNALATCSASAYVVLPGSWDRAVADKLLGNGAAMLFDGPNRTAFEEAGADWYGLTFASRRGGPPPVLALRGDSVLTLGFDAGANLYVPASVGGYAAKANDAEGYGINAGREVGGSQFARLYATTVAKGRLVWLDFSPVSEFHRADEAARLDAVMAAVFRYLVGKPYGAVAMWPEGSTYAGMFSQDTEDHYQRAARVLEWARRAELPITWYLLSNESLRHRSLTQRLATHGEVACHGDHHGDFTRSERQEQAERLARCIKVVEQITGVRPVAFRPPREAHDADTIDAVANNRLDYFFAERATDRMVPVIETSDKTGASLVSLPRIGSDDYELWHTRQLNAEASIALLEQELAWAERLGGFYAFDFHSQFMDDEHLAVLDHVGRVMRDRDVYLATGADIARWWRVRHALGRGEAVDAEAFTRYRPVWLQVERDGRLTRQPIENSADLAVLRAKAGASS